MAQLMSLPLTVSCLVKTRLVLPFWYCLTWVVLEKGPLNACVCVRVCVCVCVCVRACVCFTMEVLFQADPYLQSKWKQFHHESQNSFHHKLAIA